MNMNIAYIVTVGHQIRLCGTSFKFQCYSAPQGEYRVELPDGRTQIVTYHADHENGFVADVKYEGEAHPVDYHAPAPHHPAPHHAPAPYHPPAPAPYHPAPYHA